MQMTTRPEPSFFILTPTFNRAARLAVSIESVRNQSYENWQLFILDDGSQDATPELLARFEDDSRIHSWRFERNQGVNPARNRLLAEILDRGDPGFVVILDDDDQLEKDALTLIAKAARANPREKWLIANCHLLNGDCVSQLRDGYRHLCYVQDHKLGDALTGDVAHIFHTSIIGENRFIECFRNSEEWWFYAGLAVKSKMFALDMHAKTVEYLEDGLTLRQPNKGRGIEIYARKLERFDPFLSLSQRASLEARLARHLIRGGQFKSGLRQFWNAFRHWPFEHRIYTYGIEMLVWSLWTSNQENPECATRKRY